MKLNARKNKPGTYVASLVIRDSAGADSAPAKIKIVVS